MNYLKTSLLFFLLILAIFTSCKEDEPVAVVIEASNFTASFGTTVYNEWTDGSVIGTVAATTNSGSLNYTFVSTSIAGTMAINATTGQITVSSWDAFFNDSSCTGVNGVFTGVVRIANGSVTRDINVTVTLVDFCN